MISSLLVLIPALPLAAAILTALFGRQLKERAHVFVVVAFVLAFLAAMADTPQKGARTLWTTSGAGRDEPPQRGRTGHQGCR